MYLLFCLRISIPLVYCLIKSLSTVSVSFTRNNDMAKRHIVFCFLMITINLISCRSFQSDEPSQVPSNFWITSCESHPAIDFGNRYFKCISKDSSLFLTCTDIADAIYNLVPSVIVFRRCLLSQRGEHATPPATSFTSAGF